MKILDGKIFLIEDGLGVYFNSTKCNNMTSKYIYWIMFHVDVDCSNGNTKSNNYYEIFSRTTQYINSFFL